MENDQSKKIELRFDDELQIYRQLVNVNDIYTTNVLPDYSKTGFSATQIKVHSLNNYKLQASMPPLIDGLGSTSMVFYRRSDDIYFINLILKVIEFVFNSNSLFGTFNIQKSDINFRDQYLMTQMRNHTPVTFYF